MADLEDRAAGTGRRDADYADSLIMLGPVTEDVEFPDDFNYEEKEGQ